MNSTGSYFTNIKRQFPEREGDKVLEIRTDSAHSRTGVNGSIASQKEKWEILNAMLHIPRRENLHIRRSRKKDERK
jgi:hypothetical protein